MVSVPPSSRIKQSEVRTIRSFKKCDCHQLILDLANAPWQVMDIFDDINDKWSYWKSLFMNVIDSHAPLILRMRGPCDDWIDSELRGLMRTRNYYKKKHQKTKNREDWVKFKSLRREVNQRIRTAKAEHYATICKDISHQPKPTWDKLNSALGRTNHKSTNLLNFNGKALTQAADIVNTFVQHFNSIQSPPPPLSGTQLPHLSRTFKFSVISEHLVQKKVSLHQR